MEKEKEMTKYAEAGVNIDEGNRLVNLLKPIVSKTFQPGVITDIGGFAGLFAPNLQEIKNPVLVSSTDGVGTKLKIAFMMDKHDTVGIDLVAMCVNDIVVQGATPLFLLDYLSMSKLDVDKARDIVQGIASGCQDAECSLIGGETAEMPGFYAEGEYDLAGFVVGLAGQKQILTGEDIKPGHNLIGLGSSGLHSNGYSLVRKIFFEDLKMSAGDYVEDFGRTVGEELLEPTRIYARPINRLRKNFRIFGIAHITGGGLIDNIPRMLPESCKASIDKTKWPTQPIFSFLQKAGNISEEEMMRTFNNGIGLVIVVNQEDTDNVIEALKSMGDTAYHIGTVESKTKEEAAVQFKNQK